MIRNKSIMGTFLVSAAVFLISGCYKDKTVIFDTPADEITRTVTFAADIIPIFNTSCAVSGCHSAGGKAPELTPDKAFNALAIGGYVNTGDPESSVIYLWLTGKKSTQMPVGGINKDYNALILAWIKQGAQNN